MRRPLLPALLLLLLVGTRALAASPPKDAIWVSESDFDDFVVSGLLSKGEARSIWSALRAKRLREEGQSESPQATSPSDVTGGLAGAVQDLRGLFSLANLLYCIATTLLTSVFSFVLYVFREVPPVQGAAALGYGAVFTQWGLRLMAQGGRLPGAGPRLVGGVLLFLPNLAAAVVGGVLLQLAGVVRPRKLEEWCREARLKKPEELIKGLIQDPAFFIASLTMEVSVLLSAGLLYGLSRFPGLLVPLLAAVYLLVVSFCLRFSGVLLVRGSGHRCELLAISVPVFGSAWHAITLWSLASFGFATADIRLGMMVSACNSGFWSLPLTLYLGPLVLSRDSELEEARAARDNKAFMQAMLWKRGYFVLAFLSYSVGNVALISYGLRIGSWVPVPYALFGIVVTMLLTNSAPWHLRLAMRVFYNLPVAVALFAACSAYERVADVLWLEILSWLGQPQHFQIAAIFLVRAVTLVCAVWSLWFGMSRFLPHRLLQDLLDHRKALSGPPKQLSDVQARIAQLEADEQTEASPAQSQGWFTGGLLSRRLPRGGVTQPGAGGAALSPAARAAELVRLREEERELEAQELARRQRTSRADAWISLLEGPYAWLLGGVPLCWIGFSFLASVCDAPEPFLLLRCAMNVSAVSCAVLAFGGIVQSACDSRRSAKEDMYGAETPAKLCVPTLLFFGVRVVFLADSSILRNVAGLAMIGAGFVGLTKNQKALLRLILGVVVSAGLMVMGLLGDTKVLAFAGVICLYAVLLLLLHSAVGSNALSLVCGVTGLAMLTMHLASTSEAYFLSMQTVISNDAWPWASFLQKYASQDPIEVRFCRMILRVMGGLVFVPGQAGVRSAIMRLLQTLINRLSYAS